MLEQAISSVLGLPPLLYVLMVLLSVWYIKAKNSKSIPENIPPFPTWPIPVLGHIPMLNWNPLKALKQWHNKTGGVYSIYMGQTLTIIIGNYQALKEAFVKNAEHFSDRADRFVAQDDRFTGGIVDTNGALWKEQRGVSVSILKKFGMGKNMMGEKINIEVEAYLDTLDKLKGEPTNVRPLTVACVSNVICTILTGKRFELDDPQCKRLFEILADQFIYIQASSALQLLPWLKYLPGDLFHAKAMLQNEEIFKTEFSMKYINKIKNEHNDEPNFIQSYLDERKERKESGQETTLDEKNLVMIITNLFQAGTETSSTTLMWVLMYAIYHPELQKKLHEEIDELIGTENLPIAADKNRLKYVSAFILETQRLSSVAPLILAHQCTKTTTIAGYTIPKGALVMPYLDGMLHDPVWGDPMEFRPERFLDDEGNLVVPEYFIPFGLGRRLCPGDALAKLELFLFTAGIFQKFEVLPEDPANLPTMEPIFGLVCAPQPFKLRFIPRH